MPFTIVAENCTGCTACEKRCPTRAISGEPKKAFYIEPSVCIAPSPENTSHYLGRVVVDEKTCVGCKLCEEVCGWEGIYVMPGGEKPAFLEALGYAPADSAA